MSPLLKIMSLQWEGRDAYNFSTSNCVVSLNADRNLSIISSLLLTSGCPRISAVTFSKITIHLTKTTAMQNEVAFSYHNVRGLYFLAVVFVTNICAIIIRETIIDFILYPNLLVSAIFVKYSIFLYLFKVWICNLKNCLSPKSSLR